MPHFVSVVIDSDPVVFCDESVAIDPEQSEGRKLGVRAEDEGFLVYDHEYEATLKFLVLVNDETYDLEDVYESSHGAFRVELPSGVLRIFNPRQPKDAHLLKVDPGTYTITAKKVSMSESSNYEKRLEEAIGREDWKHLRRIDCIGMIGCLALLPVIPMAIIPSARKYLWILILAFLLPQVLMWLLKKGGRYKRAEKKRADFQEKCPHTMLLLTKAKDLPEAVMGGVVEFNDY